MRNKLSQIFFFKNNKKDKPNNFKKFGRNKKQKVIVISAIIGLILLVGGITLYRTFALYEEKKEFNMLRGQVPDYLGKTVTYYVNTGVSYQEKVKKDDNCLAPKTFTPQISGWTFVGWREDKTANANVLTSKAMGNEDITLYAVFRQPVVLTKIVNKSTTNATAYRYYNNGNVLNATFSVSNPSVSGATFLGWSTSTSATAAYPAGTKNITLSGNATIRSILKYNDVTQSVAECKNTGDWVGPGTSLQNGTQLSIDCSKYSGIKSTNCKARMKVNFDNRAVGWQLAAGGNSVTLISWWHSDYSGYGADSGIKDTPYTINFSQTSGTTSLVFSHIKNPYVDNYSSTGESSVYAHTVTLIGRTVVG